MSISLESTYLKILSGSPVIAGVFFYNRNGQQVDFSSNAETGTLSLSSQTAMSIDRLWETATGAVWREVMTPKRAVGLSPILIAGSGTIGIYFGNEVTGIPAIVLSAGEFLRLGVIPEDVLLTSSVSSVYQVNNLDPAWQDLTFINTTGGNISISWFDASFHTLSEVTWTYTANASHTLQALATSNTYTIPGTAKGCIVVFDNAITYNFSSGSISPTVLITPPDYQITLGAR